MADNRWSIGLAALDFSNYIAVNRTLIKKYGLIEAVLLGEIASEARYWLQRGELEDGWFYSTVENIESATGLNDYHQRGALKRLQEIGLVEIAYKGLPRKRYIRLDAEMLLQAMEKDNEQPSTESTSSGLNSQQLEVEIVNVNNNNQQQKIYRTTRLSHTSMTGRENDSESLSLRRSSYAPDGMRATRSMTSSTS